MSLYKNPLDPDKNDSCQYSQDSLSQNSESKNIKDEKTSSENKSEKVDPNLDKMLFEYIYGRNKALKKQESELTTKNPETYNIIFSKKLDIYTDFRYKINKDSYSSLILKDQGTGEIFDIFFSDRGLTPITYKKSGFRDIPKEPKKRKIQDNDNIKEVPSLEDIMTKGPFESIFSTLRQKIEKLEKKTETFIISLTNNNSSINKRKKNKDRRQSSRNKDQALNAVNVDKELLLTMNKYKQEEAEKYDSMNKHFDSKIKEMNTKMQKYERRIIRQRKELKKTNYIYIAIIIVIMIVWVISHNISRMNTKNSQSLEIFKQKNNLNGIVTKPNILVNAKSEKAGHLSLYGDHSIQLDENEKFEDDCLNSPGKASKTSAPNYPKQNRAKTEINES